jgi:uncharacterized protein DUF5681
MKELEISGGSAESRRASESLAIERLHPRSTNQQQVVSESSASPARKPIEQRADYATRWKPGQSGNRSGRPRQVGDMINKKLNEIVTVEREDPETGEKKKVKVQRVEIVAERLIDNACTLMPHAVSAFRAIRETVEPELADAAAGSLTVGNLNVNIIAALQRVAREGILEGEFERIG